MVAVFTALGFSNSDADTKHINPHTVLQWIDPIIFLPCFWRSASFVMVNKIIFIYALNIGKTIIYFNSVEIKQITVQETNTNNVSTVSLFACRSMDRKLRHNEIRRKYGTYGFALFRYSFSPNLMSSTMVTAADLISVCWAELDVGSPCFNCFECPSHTL